MAIRPKKPTRLLAAKILADSEKLSLHAALFKMGISPTEALREYLVAEAVDTMDLFDKKLVAGMALRRLEKIYEMAIAEGNTQVALSTTKTMLELYGVFQFSREYVKTEVQNALQDAAFRRGELPSADPEQPSVS